MTLMSVLPGRQYPGTPLRFESMGGVTCVVLTEGRVGGERCYLSDDDGGKVFEVLDVGEQ